ncbi:MAG: hypothetical protein J7J38_00330 [Candidatus Aenigmarchaeota archaeon]|nr:hypothetical protein [Candidatus Aenigmarchaeota archaeon]
MEHDDNEMKVISKLFVSKEKMIEKLKMLVNLSYGLITVVNETGEVLFEDDVESLSNSEKIFLLLLGSYFSFKSGLRDDVDVTLSEIANKLNVPNTTISAPMSNLLERSLVLKSKKGSYRININNYKRIKETLIRLRNKIGKNEVNENDNS